MPLPIPGRIADVVRQSTVQVTNGTQSSGSGVVVSPQQVITNAHVVRATDLKVESWEGAVINAKLVKLDRTRDLALLSVPGLRTEPLPLGDSNALRAGTPVLAIGNPLGFVGAVSSGVVHSLARRWIRADLRLAPGNSGGPLADFKGQMVGINTMVASDGLAYSIPSRSVQRFLSNAPRHKPGSQAVLGFHCQELAKPPRSAWPGDSLWAGVIIRPVEFQPRRVGLLVLGLVPGSAAEQASLLPGDILTGANGVRFEHVDDLPESLVHVRDGRLQIEFHRGNHDTLRHVTVAIPHA